MTEEWRDIAGWEGLYEVSSHGRVRAMERTMTVPCRHGGTMSYTKKGRILKCGYRSGYPQVQLNDQPRRCCVYVHQLVCAAFHGPPPSAVHEVAHNDGDQENARADNLRWATRTENMADTLLHGTRSRGEHRPLAKLNEKQARTIKHSDDRVTVLAARFGVTTSLVYRIKSGRAWRHLEAA